VAKTQRGGGNLLWRREEEKKCPTFLLPHVRRKKGDEKIQFLDRRQGAGQEDQKGKEASLLGKETCTHKAVRAGKLFGRKEKEKGASIEKEEKTRRSLSAPEERLT